MSKSRRLRAIIVDDEPAPRQKIWEMLKSDPDVEVVAECASGPYSLCSAFLPLCQCSRERITGTVGSEVDGSIIRTSKRASMRRLHGDRSRSGSPEGSLRFFALVDNKSNISSDPLKQRPVCLLFGCCRSSGTGKCIPDVTCANGASLCENQCRERYSRIIPLGPSLCGCRAVW
jgi:hypothetical protein